MDALGRTSIERGLCLLSAAESLGWFRPTVSQIRDASPHIKTVSELVAYIEFRV